MYLCRHFPVLSVPRYNFHILKQYHPLVPVPLCPSALQSLPQNGWRGNSGSAPKSLSRTRIKGPEEGSAALRGTRPDGCFDCCRLVRPPSPPPCCSRETRAAALRLSLRFGTLWAERGQSPSLQAGHGRSPHRGTGQPRLLLRPKPLQPRLPGGT